jgi:putative tryptophan/tyrosine transport system substrate-binding protein
MVRTMPLPHSATRPPRNLPSRRSALVRGLGLVGTLAALPLWAQGPSPALAVLYPQIGEPFRAAFATILEGIRQQLNADIPAFALAGDGLLPAQSNELLKHDPRLIIALGRSGLKAVKTVGSSATVIVGCVLGMPESQAQAYTVHTLAPDPALVFAGLRKLVPAARRVFVVADPQQNAWLLRLAHEAARALGLELVARDAADLMQATRAYTELLTHIEPRRDALWLPQDSTTVEESTLLPMVLEQSWQRGFPLISSNAVHVKRGALFALYPDNAALGRSLGLSALDTLAHPLRAPRGLQPLRDVLFAANQRTAAHLGIALNPRSQRIDKVYPEP